MFRAQARCSDAKSMFGASSDLCLTWDSDLCLARDCQTAWCLLCARLSIRDRQIFYFGRLLSARLSIRDSIALQNYMCREKCESWTNCISHGAKSTRSVRSAVQSWRFLVAVKTFPFDHIVYGKRGACTVVNSNNMNCQTNQVRELIPRTR